MSFLKKWASCIVSFVAGVLGLALSVCTGMSVNVNIDASALGAAGAALTQNTTENVKAYEVVTNAERADQAELLGIDGKFTTLKVFSVIMLVISVLLIVYALVMLLKNLNVIKSDSKLFDIAGYVLIALFFASNIAVLGSTFGYAAAFESAMTDSVLAQVGAYASVVKVEILASVGVYQWIMLAVSVLASATTGVFAFLNKRS